MPRKNKIIERSSAIYMLDPEHLRSLGLELMKRNRENAFGSHPEIKCHGKEHCAREYDKLKASIDREGFWKDNPILVMLNRQDGLRDKIREGHHRLAIAIELKLPHVPVQFVVGEALQEDNA